MEDLLRSKSVYLITMGKEKELPDVDKKVKWDNRSDEEHVMIRVPMSLDLRFHLQ
jgi:hypothetical protein